MLMLRQHVHCPFSAVKFEGHAKQEDIAQCCSTMEDTFGNFMADKAADEGIALAHQFQQLAKAAKHRICLASFVQRMVVAISSRTLEVIRSLRTVLAMKLGSKVSLQVSLTRYEQVHGPVALGNIQSPQVPRPSASNVKHYVETCPWLWPHADSELKKNPFR